MTTSSRQANRINRHRRVRAHVHGTAKQPRLAVFKSNKYIYAQLIDDDSGTTLAEANSRGGKKDAMSVGKAIAKAAQDKKITQVVFDRGGFLYAGNVKALADGAREGGLTF